MVLFREQTLYLQPDTEVPTTGIVILLYLRSMY